MMKKFISILALSSCMAVTTIAAPITADLTGDTITYAGDTYIKISSTELPKISGLTWKISDADKKLKQEFDLSYTLETAKAYIKFLGGTNTAIEEYKAYTYYQNVFGLSEDEIKCDAAMYIEWSEVADITRHLGAGIIAVQDGKILPMHYKKTDYSADIQVLKGLPLACKRFLFYNKTGGKIQLYNSYTNELLNEITPWND